MPRKTLAPEYNKPEVDFIKGKFSMQKIAANRRRLCAVCAVGDCSLLPITTQGDDCPYFHHKPEVKTDA